MESESLSISTRIREISNLQNACAVVLISAMGNWPNNQVEKNNFLKYFLGSGGGSLWVSVKEEDKHYSWSGSKVLGLLYLYLIVRCFTVKSSQVRWNIC